MMDKLQIQVYTDEISEYNAMLQTPAGSDIGDSPVPKSFESTFLADTRFYLSAPNSAFDNFDLEFNHANTFFGIPDNFGNNPSGVQFRQAIAHLIDKNAFITSVLGGLATPKDNPILVGQGFFHPGLPCDASSPNGATALGCPASAFNGPYSFSYNTNGLGGTYNLVGSCAWETIASLQTGCLSAYHNAADIVDSAGIVTASASNPDFCEAAQHLVNAGLANGIAADCSVAGHFTGTGSITFFIRSDSIPRTKLGFALAARMCELFNGAGVTSCSQVTVFQGTSAQAVPIVYSTSSISNAWHMYTGGPGLTPEFDRLFKNYNSQFASSACGGHHALFGQDYVYFCNSSYDHFSSMFEFNDTKSGAVASAQIAMQIFGDQVASIPLWSSAIEVPYLKGWTGISDANGIGPPNFFSTLNGWNPNPAIPGTLRWGFKQGTVNLNPFLASTPYEFRIIQAVYDSLVQTTPYNPTTPFAWLANSFANADPATNPQCASVPGTIQCLAFILRPNVFFHDGVALTANDVKFSMLAFKEIPGPLSSSVAGVVDVTYLAGPIPSTGTQTVFVHLNSKSPFAMFNVGGVPIIPQHIWAQTTTSPCPGTVTGPLPTTGPCAADTTKAALDPVTNHILIGTGPWECKDTVTGVIGGGCTLTASGSQGTQAVDAGGTILLQRFGFGFPGYDSTHSYFRGSRLYKVWQWADAFNHGSVDAWSASALAQCFNVPVSNHPGCLHWVSPAATVTCVSAAGSCNAGSLSNTELGGNNEAQAGILETTAVGALVEVSWTSPLAYSALLGVQPVPQTLYEGGITYSGSTPSAGQPVPGPANLYVNASATRVQAAGSTFTVQIKVANAGSFNSWDVQVGTNPSSIRATTLSMVPNVFSNTGGFQLEQIHCVEGTGTGCIPSDGPGVVHSALISSVSASGGGPLFNITYQVVGGASPINIITPSLSPLIVPTVTCGAYGSLPLPDFTVFINPDHLTVAPGSSASSTVFLTDFNGMKTNLCGTVDLRVIPSAIGNSPITLNPASMVVNGTATSTLRISTDASTPIGTYFVIVNGTSGSLSRFAAILITVTTGTIGGVEVPVDKLRLLAPYIGLASVISTGSILTMAYLKRIKSRRTKDDQAA